MIDPCFVMQYLRVLSSFVIILLRKREPITLHMFFDCVLTVV